MKTMKVKVVCGKCQQEIDETIVPLKLYEAMQERRRDYQMGLISRELFLYEMSACLRNKLI